jgi:hypothetical protein
MRREANRRFIRFLVITFIALFAIWCLLNAVGVRLDFEAFIAMCIAAVFALPVIFDGIGASANDKGYKFKGDRKGDSRFRDEHDH